MPWQNEQIIDRRNVTTKAVDERLAPCPFCGGAAMLGIRPAFQEFFAMCAQADCGAYLAKQDNNAFASEKLAIAAWNHRLTL